MIPYQSALGESREEELLLTGRDLQEAFVRLK